MLVRRRRALVKPGKVYLLTFVYPSTDEVRGFLTTRNDFWADEPYSDSYSFVLGASDIKTEEPPSWDLFAGINEGGLWVEVMNKRGERILADFIRAIPEWFGAVALKEESEPSTETGLAPDGSGCAAPCRRIVLSPEWRTDTAVALARQMHNTGDFSALPILADALQDAGCDTAEILGHCRGSGRHVRGCWVVDLLLEKA